MIFVFPFEHLQHPVGNHKPPAPRSSVPSITAKIRVPGGASGSALLNDGTDDHHAVNGIGAAHEGVRYAGTYDRLMLHGYQDRRCR